MSGGHTVVMLNSMSFLPYQGRYLRIYNEAKTLVDAGYDVTLVAWDRECASPRQEMVDGIKVERVALRSGMVKGPTNAHRHLLCNALMLGKILSRPVDVVHCFNLDTIMAGLVAAKLKRAKVTLDLCEPNYYMYWPEKYLSIARGIQHLERIVAPRFDYVFVHNLYQVRKFRSYGIERLAQISSVPAAHMILDDVRGRPRREKGTVVLGRIGMIYPASGIEETVEAVRLLLERGAPVELLFAGKVLETYQEAFDKLIEPIKDHVILTGPFDVSEMPQMYKKIDISLQLHKRNPWFRNITPTKFFESLANGVPVIASDIGDYKELMEAYPCGIVVDENDPHAICDAVQALLDDPMTLVKMAEAGLELVKKEYSWPIMAKRLLEAYRSLERG